MQMECSSSLGEQNGVGEIQYPMNIYKSQCLWRPCEAEDGQLIKADYDIEMLKAMY
jgi:hypothetical protein